MRRQIRRCTFETNSSSTHSIVICSKEEYSKFDKGELVFDSWDDVLVPIEKAVQKVKEWKRVFEEDDMDDIEIIREAYEQDNRFQLAEDFFNDEYLETYQVKYTTQSGDDIIAFGKYGTQY